MKYTKKEGSQGPWFNKEKKDEVKNGTEVKIVEETKPVDSGEFGTQDVTKIRVDGYDETYNVNLNNATINALIDAFGDDSESWIKKSLTIHTERMIVGGKRVTAMWLIPEGYQLDEDENGYIVVVPKEDDIPIVENEDDANAELQAEAEEQK